MHLVHMHMTSNNYRLADVCFLELKEEMAFIIAE